MQRERPIRWGMDAACLYQAQKGASLFGNWAVLTVLGIRRVFFGPVDSAARSASNSAGGVRNAAVSKGLQFARCSYCDPYRLCGNANAKAGWLPSSVINAVPLHASFGSCILRCSSTHKPLRRAISACTLPNASGEIAAEWRLLSQSPVDLIRENTLRLLNNRLS